MSTFCNPVSPYSAPDPFVTYDSATGYYYSLFTRGNCLELFRCRQIEKLWTDGESKVIYEPNGERDGVWGDIWAPEMHRGSNGKWYIYTSGRHLKEPSRKQLFIMEALSDDPFGDWQFKCKPNPAIFSIDPTIYTAANGKQFICYSTIEAGQFLEIRAMENPYTFGPEKALIAKAEYDWELVPPYVDDFTINEGAFFVEEHGRLYIIYSGNGCWSEQYCLGVLEYVGDDRCDPAKMCCAANWIKHDKPILGPGNGVYGPGHASFFHSPDGSELWCAYHGMKDPNPNAIPAPRYVHLQKVNWDETGYPVMGLPVGSTRSQSVPR